MKMNNRYLEGIKILVAYIALLVSALGILYLGLFFIPMQIGDAISGYDKYCQSVGYDKKHRTNYGAGYIICEKQDEFKTFKYSDYSIWFAETHDEFMEVEK